MMANVPIGLSASKSGAIAIDPSRSFCLMSILHLTETDKRERLHAHAERATIDSVFATLASCRPANIGYREANHKTTEYYPARFTPQWNQRRSRCPRSTVLEMKVNLCANKLKVDIRTPEVGCITEWARRITACAAVPIQCVEPAIGIGHSD